MGTPIGRGVALWLGAFTLLNLPGRENLWWIDVRPLPAWVLAIPAVVLLVHGLWPHRWQVAVAACTGTLVAALLIGSVRYFGLPIERGWPVPFTLVAAGALLLVLRGPKSRRPRLALVVTLGALTAGFPVAQVLSYGTTSYARSADAIVVFGARCYADGTPSQSLEDRVRTGVRLFHEGRAPRLVLSGGPGDGVVHETDAMRDLAMRLEVPAEAIVLDRAGLSTRDTVRHSPPGSVLAVSHFYHLPRIQLAYRAEGRTAYTVPAEEAYTISQTPWLIAREVAAFWTYWARSIPPRGLRG